MAACNVTLTVNGQHLSPEKIVELVGATGRLPLEINDGANEVAKFNFGPARGVFSPTFKNESGKKHSCHLQALSENGELSSLSACGSRDVSAVLVFNGRTYVIVHQGRSLLLLPQSHDTCEFARRSVRAAPTKGKTRNGLPDYYRDYTDNNERFVELALFADMSVYKKYGEDIEKVNTRLETIANHVNALYNPLRISVRLIYKEVWTEADKFEVQLSGDKTLGLFLNYRKTMLDAHPHDNAHLITDIRFEQGVVGKAFKGTMCSIDYSGGVDVDHSEHAALVAATVAHEMGHNFGMGHDAGYDGTCKCPGDHCIMAPNAGYVAPSYWSDCSLKQLFNALDRGVDECLHNNPDLPTGSGAKCGNGVVESGEECDCGAEVCPHACCNGATCKLEETAECAAGGCCDLNTCKIKTKSVMCRDSTNICDLPEFCNGETGECPPDFYAQDGKLCRDRTDEYCFNGECGSRNDQCKAIWGPNSKSAHDSCFSQNSKGNIYGNCGTATDGNFTRCATEDNKCGRLHCESMAERPIFGDPTTVTSVFSGIRIGATDHQCKVIKTQYRGSKRSTEPGMVNDGAVCAKDKVCISTKCTRLDSFQKTTTDCENNCYSRGVCNNVGNCHCDVGYGGVDCGVPGYGGSVNSNPAALSRGFSTLYMAIFIVALFWIVFAGLTIYYKRKKNIWLPSICWAYTKKKLDLRGVLVPVRKAPPPPGGHRPMKKDSLNAAWGQGVTYRTADNSLPQFHAIAPTLPTIPSGNPLNANGNAYHPPPTNAHGYPSQAHVSSNRSGATVSRTGSLRPGVPPPSVPLRPRNSTITALHQECADELGLRGEPKELEYPDYVVPPPDPEPSRKGTSSKIQRSESMNRPVQAPPPPPHKPAKPLVNKQLVDKPKIPVKPPVAVKPRLETSEDEDSQALSVQDIRAKFDRK